MLEYPDRDSVQNQTSSAQFTFESAHLLSLSLLNWTDSTSSAPTMTIYKEMLSPHRPKGVPDPVGMRFRRELNEVINRVLRERQTADAATAELGLSEDDIQLFRPRLAQELRILDVYNCGRYRLSLDLVQQWVEAGRPH